MPFLILGLLLCLLVAVVAVIGLSLALRYRAGTARRQARRWVAGVNVWCGAIGAGFFLLTAGCMSFWIPEAFSYAFLGMLAGAVLGLVGLALTRWETEASTFYYTPNRWLALFIVVAVAGRIAYAWWRGAHGVTAEHPASGIALSLGIAAVVIGYYFIYAVGVRSRLARHQRRRVHIAAPNARPRL